MRFVVQNLNCVLGVKQYVQSASHASKQYNIHCPVGVYLYE